MKMTIELPDDLLIAAKKRAAELRCSLKVLVERGLRRELAIPTPRRESKKRRMRWITVRGGLAPGLDVTDRAAMYDWLTQHRSLRGANPLRGS